MQRYGGLEVPVLTDAVLTTAVVSPDPVASPAEITTVLPARAVPVTVIWPPVAAAVAVTVRGAGGACRT